MKKSLLLSVALLSLVGARLPLAADIVILASGDFIKIDSYEVGTDSIRIVPTFGGSIVLPLRSIERILDDEVVAGGPGAQTFDLIGVELGFNESQAVPQTEFAEMFYEVGRRYSLNPRLLASIASTESAFEPWARSNKGAIGIMQVMPATAERFGVDPGNLYDPLVCMDVGAQYLSALRQRYDGDLVLMLAAYNAGESTVERFGGVPPYQETQTYIRRVYRTYTEGPG